MASLSLDNPLLHTYLAYSAILALKVLFLASYTAITRTKKNVYANPEDLNLIKKGSKLKFDDPDVERVRRAHLNDLENIPFFFVLAFMYILTGPSVWLATLLFRLYTAGRILHTIVYVFIVLPQPARGLGFLVPYAIKWYMGINVLLYFSSAL